MYDELRKAINYINVVCSRHIDKTRKTWFRVCCMFADIMRPETSGVYYC